MGFFLKKKKISAGLMLDSGVFRYLSLECADDVYTVVDSVTEKIPEGYMHSDDPFEDNGAYLDLIFSYISSSISSFHTAVNFALPITESLLRIVAMPGMTLPEAKQAFRYDFENYFPFAERDGVYDIAEIDYPLTEDTTEQRFLAAAARRTLLDNIAKGAAAHNIRLLSLEPAQIALERAASPAVPIEDACVFVYAGQLRSVLILSWHGNGIFYRNISFGFPAETMAKGADSDEYRDNAFSFVRDIRSSLQFALSQNRGFSTKSLYLFGPGATPYLRDLMKDSITMGTVMQVDPMKIHGIDFRNSGEWDIALGLAMR
ncbi:MAG: hypothetical protein RRY12_00610 [Cloacibacillus sp.]